MVMADRLDTIPITCCLDGQPHDVTAENVAAGQSPPSTRHSAAISFQPRPWSLRLVDPAPAAPPWSQYNQPRALRRGGRLGLAAAGLVGAALG